MLKDTGQITIFITLYTKYHQFRLYSRVISVITILAWTATKPGFKSWFGHSSVYGRYTSRFNFLGKTQRVDDNANQTMVHHLIYYAAAAVAATTTTIATKY